MSDPSHYVNPLLHHMAIPPSSITIGQPPSSESSTWQVPHHSSPPRPDPPPPGWASWWGGGGEVTGWGVWWSGRREGLVIPPTLSAPPTTFSTTSTTRLHTRRTGEFSITPVWGRWWFVCWWPARSARRLWTSV